MFCNKCGANMPEGSAFCSSCGQSFAKNPIIQPLNQPTAPPPYTPPPVYGAPSTMAAPLLPKKRRTGLIVLVSILSLFAAAAITLLCIKLFVLPTTEPNGFDDVYNSLIQSALTTSTTETTQETPVPTDTLQQTPVPQVAAIELPFEFTQLDYPTASFSAMQFSSKADFETALWATSWLYQTSETNPDAMMFNGGFVDIAPEISTSNMAYAFNSDYSVALLEFNPDDNNVFYEEAEVYWTQDMGGVFCAVADLETQGVYDGAGYDAVLLMFINSQGNLVESLALYDAHTQSVIHISNFNVLIPGTVSTDALTPTVNSASNHMPMEWRYDEEFEETLMAVMWQFVETEDMPKAFDIQEFRDLSATTASLVFNTDYTLDAVLTDSTEDTINYDIGYLHAFIVIGEYEYDGVVYEVNYHYYIDNNGYLIESIKFYDYDLDEYLLVSNVNVYKSISP